MRRGARDAASASRTARKGRLQVIDGKARLISDIFCDGLGACIGTCPEGAISVIEREAAPYDEKTVMATIAKQGVPVIKAHLEHLAGHGQVALYNEAIEYLIGNGIPIPDHTPPMPGKSDDPAGATPKGGSAPERTQQTHPAGAGHAYPGGPNPFAACPGSAAMTFHRTHSPATAPGLGVGQAGSETPAVAGPARPPEPRCRLF